MGAAVVFWITSLMVYMVTGYPHEGPAMQAQDSNVDTQGMVSSVASANKEFAFTLYRRLAVNDGNHGKNIFFSPLSVSSALAALSVGARGETHRQIFSGLGLDNLSLSQTDLNGAFRSLLENQVSGEDATKGTAVFVDSRFKAQHNFLDVLKQSYFSDGFAVDFTKSTDAADTINKYVADKTNGKIDKLVESLDPNTAMYLLSYIYFKGKWASPFESRLTKEDTFTVEQNNKVPVQMMKKKDNFDVYYDQAINTSVLHLPFNSSYSMLLALPDDLTTLENVINSAYVSKWLKWKKSRNYNIYVPKFSIKTSYKLNNVLTEMGMTDMFSDRADLSGISEGQKLVVSEVVHQATLDVDEAGATAAAATGIGVTVASFRHIPVLKFNRPFMAFIIQPSTEKILFMGRIVNPNI
ncbi:alpha-1-antiproteinase-like [Menidia menidia]